MIKKLSYALMITITLLSMILSVSAADYIKVETPEDVTVSGRNLFLTYAYTDDYQPSMSKWQVRHGTSLYNISIPDNCYYNTTHYYFRLESMIADAGAEPGYSAPFCNNGSDWILIGTNISGNGISGGSGGSSATWYDEDYTTYAVREITGPSYITGATGSGAIAGRIYEESVYWYTGTLQDTLFYITDRFGNYQENANITVTRVNDGKLIGTLLTDLSGAAEFELSDGTQYRVNVTKTGYNNFSAIINAYETSYTIRLTSGAQDPFNSVFNYVSVVTTPAQSPIIPNITNFTITINATNGTLTYWGVLSNFNGSYYANNQTVAGGGTANITIDLTNNNNDTINVLYYFYLADHGYYAFNQSFLIYSVVPTDTSLASIISSISSEVGPTGKAILGSFILVLVMILITMAGIPGEWAAPAVMIPGMVVLIAAGWISYLVGGLVIMITIGLVIIRAKGA